VLKQKELNFRSCGRWKVRSLRRTEETDIEEVGQNFGKTEGRRYDRNKTNEATV
jgi:hypothetical protein